MSVSGEGVGAGLTIVGPIVGGSTGGKLDMVVVGGWLCFRNDSI